MNFILGAIIIVIIVSPGFAFRLAYLTRSYTQIFKASFTEEFAFAILPTLIIQVPLYLFVNEFICNVDEYVLYNILINSDKIFPSAKSISLFSLYSLVAIVAGALLGVAFKKVSISNNWHLKYRFLKIYNDWEEYFSGKVLDRPDMPGSSSDVAVAWLDMLVVTAGETYLYSGWLAYFTITPDEKLDRVFLKGVRRKKLDTVKNRRDQLEQLMLEATDKDPNYFMPGDYFIVLGEEIKNVNITYYAERPI